MMTDTEIAKKKPTRKEREAAKLAKAEQRAREREVRNEEERIRQAEIAARTEAEFRARLAGVLGRTPTDEDRAMYGSDTDLVIALVMGRAPTDEDRRIYEQFTYASNMGEREYVGSRLKVSP